MEPTVKWLNQVNVNIDPKLSKISNAEFQQSHISTGSDTAATMVYIDVLSERFTKSVIPKFISIVIGHVLNIITLTI